MAFKCCRCSCTVCANMHRFLSFFKFVFRTKWYRLSCECSLSFRHQISEGNVSWNTGGSPVMFVANDVHVYWLRRFITAWAPLPLSLTQCDKMQSAVKRKAGKKKTGKRRRLLFNICVWVSVCVCVCVCVSSSLVFLQQEITPFGGTALKHYPLDRIHG